ncbi:phage tail assembly chaperone G [Lysinibacillus xylanilyticus]|uniref:phage tail assembly chaperone G n=1 Tax=Lysinibacillus xylanilyticus TaxID=582475 RepID=UPI003D08B6D9
MQITLKINGQEKIFSNDFVKARVFRNALKMNEKMRKEGNEISVETFDEMISFVVNVFDNQFTIDDVWDGLEAGRLQEEIMRVFNNVLNIGGLETKPALNDDEGKLVE